MKATFAHYVFSTTWRGLSSLHSAGKAVRLFDDEGVEGELCIAANFACAYRCRTDDARSPPTTGL